MAHKQSQKEFISQEALNILAECRVRSTYAVASKNGGAKTETRRSPTLIDVLRAVPSLPHSSYPSIPMIQKKMKLVPRPIAQLGRPRFMYMIEGIENFPPVQERAATTAPVPVVPAASSALPSITETTSTPVSLPSVTRAVDQCSKVEETLEISAPVPEAADETESVENPVGYIRTPPLLFTTDLFEPDEVARESLAFANRLWNEMY